MIRTMTKLAIMAALAAGAATGSTMESAAHAATTPVAHAVAVQNTHAVAARSLHSNVTLDAGNGCSTVTQNGWNIGVCSNTQVFEAWGDGYINSHGVMPSGCVIELDTYITDDPGGTEEFSTYPCSMFGHIGPNTYTGLTAGDHIHTTVTVHGDFENVFSWSYTN